jgi:P27 family predicted phage terminase small subunit
MKPLNGPAPLPTVLKMLRGTLEKKRMPKKSANVNKGIPDVPECVLGDAVALKEWKRVTKVLHEVGLLGKIDGVTLANYCILYSQWLDATARLRKQGLFVVVGKKGYVLPSNELAVWMKIQDKMLVYLREFGMTPSARSRIDISSNVEPEEEGGKEFA